MKASMSVFSTSWIEALRNTLVFIGTTKVMPLGSSFFIWSILARILLITSKALLPADCMIIMELPGWPLAVDLKLYIKLPSSTLATSVR